MLIRRFPLQRRVSQKDCGVTLVELLVYMILLSIVLSIIMTVIITAMRKQTEIVSTSQANDKAQTIVSVIDMTVSNATGIDVVEPETPGASQLLITATRGTFLDQAEGGVIRCVGVFYNAETGSLHQINTPVGANPATKVARDNNFSGADSWPILAYDVEPIDGYNMFAGPGSQQFADEGLTGRIGVKVNLNISTFRDKPPVTINQFASARGDRNDSAGCW